MKRREFITALGGAVAWPAVARAQPVGMPVIGFLYSGSPEGGADRVVAFRRGLSDASYSDGQNVTIEFRWARDQYDRLPILAAELVQRRVNVLYSSGGTPSAVAAKAATKTIPVVFQIAADPTETGLVTSINRPEANVTGVAAFSRELVAKRLEIIRELIPDVALIAFLGDPTSPVADNRRNDFEAAARAIGQPFHVVRAGNNEQIDAAFDELADRQIRAVVLQGAPRFNNQRDRILALTARHRIAAIYEERENTRSGGLISYGSNILDSTRKAAVYVARILNGERPTDLPVLLPTAFELVINLKTAAALGLTVPPTLLARADEVIE